MLFLYLQLITYHFALNNNWIYDVTTDDGTNPATSSVDDITVDETSTINSNEYYGMASSIGSTGTMSQLFDQNFFRVDNGILICKVDLHYL